MKHKDKPINWGKVVKVALAQDMIVKAVFCARCVWLIGKLVGEKKPNKKLLVTARVHYLGHVNAALVNLAISDKKLVDFKKRQSVGRKK